MWLIAGEVTAVNFTTLISVWDQFSFQTTPRDYLCSSIADEDLVVKIFITGLQYCKEAFIRRFANSHEILVRITEIEGSAQSPRESQIESEF